MIVNVTVLTVPAADAELAADRMMVAGAFAVEERNAGGGRVELRGTVGESLAVAFDRLGDLPAGWEVRLEAVDATPSEAWREHVVPVGVTDDLVLRPAWLPAGSDQDVTEIAIEPGCAFGLGDHPTTRLAAAATWRLARNGDRVLDVGCGTGVLAIVAVRRGAVHATAIDIAEAAVPATIGNAIRNGVEERIAVSTRPLADVDGTFDLVLANILAPALVSLADDLRRTTATTGCLVISGILADRHEHVLAALAPMDAVEVSVLDGWAAVELRHQPPPDP